MDKEPDDSERNPLAVVSLGSGAIALVLLLASDWYFSKGGYPPPAFEKYVIGAGFAFSLLAVGTGIVAIEGRPLYRVAGTALGILSLLGWGLMFWGANL